MSAIGDEHPFLDYMDFIRGVATVIRDDTTKTISFAINGDTRTFFDLRLVARLYRALGADSILLERVDGGIAANSHDWKVLEEFFEGIEKRRRGGRNSFFGFRFAVKRTNEVPRFVCVDTSEPIPGRMSFGWLEKTVFPGRVTKQLKNLESLLAEVEHRIAEKRSNIDSILDI